MHSLSLPRFSVNPGSLENDVTHSNATKYYGHLPLPANTPQTGIPVYTYIHVGIRIEELFLENDGLYKLNLTSKPGVEIMYAINTQGVIYISTRPMDIHRPHPTLIGGTEPEALGAGLLKIQDGLIKEVDFGSGHFRPTPLALESVFRAFSRLPESIFHVEFLGFSTNDKRCQKIIPAFTRLTGIRIKEALCKLQLEEHLNDTISIVNNLNISAEKKEQAIAKARKRQGDHENSYKKRLEELSSKNKEPLF